MSKIMLVNVTHVEESRVAILDDGVLAAYEIETTNRSHVIGNIHNAVVENVLPSLEAAFVRLGPDLKGFLPLDEVNFRLLPARGDSRAKGKISQHLHKDQKLMAQVVRAPFSGKPPTVSTYFSLPGKYLVLMPGVDAAGVSRKIDDQKQRDRLKKIAGELNPPEGFGIIVRTAGFGQTKTELQRDLRYLLRLWESIQRASAKTEFPGLVYQERDLVIRTMRDYFTPDISEVWIDSKETYERALAFVKDIMPTKAKTIRLYTGDRPLFNKFNLEEQIESIYQRQVSLPSGGQIVIDGTEALTAIDVNSARSAAKGDAEEMVTKTNTEAAAEIARQFRLRDLGGLVVIDFIDMAMTRNKKKVEKAMRDALRGDRARYDLTPISKLGLMEIARQRLKGEKMGASYAACPTCEGYGLVRNVESAALAALRKLQTRVLRADVGRIRMALPPEVAHWILNNKREDLTDLERRQRVKIQIAPTPKLLRHQVEFETFPREKTEEPPALVGLDRPSPAIPPDLAEMTALSEASGEEAPKTPAAESAEGDTAPRRRRRRRRRTTRPPGEDGAQPTETPKDESSETVTAAAGGNGDSPEPDVIRTGASADDDATTEQPQRRWRRRRRRRSRAEAPAGDRDEM
ncbi:MAG: Rne/Rng family ribonuclease, partial [Acidobacteriota bacterium]|nr:Rne/Rng family ribonuclease [Acidobacteriota bacterium]